MSTLCFGGFSLETAIKGLAKMKNLKLLYIRVSNECDDKVSEHLPSSLRFLTWQFPPPFSSLPNTFQHLVGLELICSNIVQLREDGEEKVLNNLRFFDIKSSKLRTFDLRLTPNLEHLTIFDCHDFVELHIPADHHSKLQHLDLGANKELVLLPELGRVKCLKELNIRGTGIRSLPQSILQMKGLRIIGSTEIFESYGLTYKIQTTNKGTIIEDTFGTYES